MLQKSRNVRTNLQRQVNKIEEQAKPKISFHLKHKSPDGKRKRHCKLAMYKESYLKLFDWTGSHVYREEATYGKCFPYGFITHSFLISRHERPTHSVGKVACQLSLWAKGNKANNRPYGNKILLCGTLE